MSILYYKSRLVSSISDFRHAQHQDQPTTTYFFVPARRQVIARILPSHAVRMAFTTAATAASAALSLKSILTSSYDSINPIENFLLYSRPHDLGLRAGEIALHIEFEIRIVQARIEDRLLEIQITVYSSTAKKFGIMPSIRYAILTYQNSRWHMQQVLYANLTTFRL